MVSKLRSTRLNRGILFLLIPGIVLGLVSLVIALGGNGVVADGGFPTSRSVLKGVQQALNAPQASDASMVSAPKNASRIPPDGSDGIDMTTIIAGFPTDGVPCFGCIEGSLSPFTLGLPFPTGTLFMLQPTQIILTFDVGFNFPPGPCTVAYIMRSGATVINGGSFEGFCNPGTINLAAFDTTVPAMPGPILLLGLVVSGGGVDFLFNQLTIE